MKLATPKNKNYCAVVVELRNFATLDNCDNVKAALIFGYSVIVGKDIKAGDVGLFFPVECQLSQEFLGKNNLFRKAEYGNADPDAKTGYFESHGRIKAVKFRGHKSEGFWLPLSSVAYLGLPIHELKPGMEFDELDGHEICRKFVPKPVNVRGPGQPKGSKATSELLIDGQFRFHHDTENLRRNAHALKLGQTITITDKWHGTSAVFANLKVNRKLKWWERLLLRLGVRIETSEYRTMWSSRTVVKGIEGYENEKRLQYAGYYGTDVWARTYCDIKDVIPKGYSIYGEIVGYVSVGSFIQKGYHYSCLPGGYQFRVYRVTKTNEDGRVLELSWPQVKAFCEKAGLEHVLELYHGPVDKFQLLNPPREGETTGELLVRALEELYVNDGMCPHNNNEVPAEGVVVRIEGGPIYKLKNFKFLEWETKALDKGEVSEEL